MDKECKCQTVKRYDDSYQCMICRRKFLPADSVTGYIEDVLKARGAQISIVGDLLTAVIKLTKGEQNP